MGIKFERLLEGFDAPQKVRIGLVWGMDQATIRAVYHPSIRDFVTPIFIGEKKQLQESLRPFDQAAQVMAAEDEQEAAEIGANMAQEHQLDILMKGHLQSRTFLKTIVSRKLLMRSPLLNHIAVNDLPDYPKLILTTDGGMVLKPTIEQKKQLIGHAVEVMKKIGVTHPKVGILAASEIVNPNVSSSVEAAELKRFYQNETSFTVEGPISLDLAMSRSIAEVKHYLSPVAGEADILVGPDITAMNLLGKSMTLLAGGEMAGLVTGAYVPIVMTSRGSTEKEKLYAILLALYCSKGG